MFTFRHHFVRELVEEKLAIIKNVPYEKQLADIITKPLHLKSFLHFRKALGIYEQ